MLLSSSMPFEEFMQSVYNVLVPHIYIPEPSVMHSILKDLEASGHVEYIPQLWSDMKIFDHITRSNLLQFLLDIMVDNKPQSAELAEQFANIASDLYTFITTQQEDRTNFVR